MSSKPLIGASSMDLAPARAEYAPSSRIITQPWHRGRRPFDYAQGSGRRDRPVWPSSRTFCALCWPQYGNRSRRRSAIAFRLSPPIAEGREILDLVKGGVALTELVADAFDSRSDIDSITIDAGSRDEAFVVHAVVKGSIRHVLASIGSQKLNDVVFA